MGSLRSTLKSLFGCRFFHNKSCLLCFLMPDHSRHERSSADDGVYLLPYWVQGGRLGFVILAVLFFVGVILPFSAAWFGRRTFSNGIG